MTFVEPPGATTDFTVRMESVVAVRSVAWAEVAVSAGTAPRPAIVARATPVAIRRSSVVVMQDLLVGAHPGRCASIPTARRRSPALHRFGHDAGHGTQAGVDIVGDTATCEFDDFSVAHAK